MTPFVNQQFSLQVVERGREFQFVEQFSSDEDVTSAGRHSAHRRSDSMHTARPSTFFFIWPSTCFNDLPFICGWSRSTRRTACVIGHVRLLVCCRHLIQGRGQVRALAGVALQHAERVTTISGFLSSSVKLHGRRTISGKLLAFGFVGTMRLLSNYFDLLLPI